MSGTKVVHDLIHNGDLYRIITDGKTFIIRVYEHGLNKGYELDLKELPTAVREFIRDKYE